MRKRLWTLIPAWVALPLAFLGLCFLIFGNRGTSEGWYIAAIVLAVVMAVWTKLAYRSEVLWTRDRNALVWMSWGPRDDSVSPPVLVDPSEAARADPVAMRDADKLEHLRQQKLITSDEYLRLKEPTTDRPPGTPTTKACPDCAESILSAARVCRYCGYRFDATPTST